MKKKSKPKPSPEHAFEARRRLVIMLDKKLVLEIRQRAFAADQTIQYYVSTILSKHLESK